MSTSNVELYNKIKEFRGTWYPATDQYDRTVLHLAALNGNTKLVVGLINSGARINARDGIDQTALTLALHKEHFNTAKKTVD
jgi:ankyrin repeat protein